MKIKMTLDQLKRILRTEDLKFPIVFKVRDVDLADMSKLFKANKKQ